MGNFAIYKCNKCGHEFESREGGGFIFDEYRCEKCDEIKRIKLKGKNERVPIEPIGKCGKCGGVLKEDLRPMCPKCKARSPKELKLLTFYD